jgi:hypothetical protein
LLKPGEGRGKGEVYEGKRPFARHRRRWDDNINMDFSGNRIGARTGLIWLRTGTGGLLL